MDGPSAADWKAAKWFAIAVSVVAFALIIASALKIQVTGDGRLVVVASAEEAGDKSGTWTVSGHASEGSGGPAPGASMTLTAVTKSGATQTYPSVKTEDTGAFAFSKVKKDSADPVREFQVVAFKATAWYQLDKHGRFAWQPGGAKPGSTRTSDVGFGTGFAIAPACFALSLILVAFFSIQERIGKSYHFVPCLLAIVATVSMCVHMGYGIRWVNDHFEPGQQASFGFVTFHQGTYVKGGSVDWLVSLTRPLNAAAGTAVQPAEPTLEAGLGAPLWVVFVSVLGSGLLTLVLVIGEILKPLPTEATPENREIVQKRFRGILEHQFFVLFSPLAGIILYQLMLAGGAAGQPVVVAVVVLGAGATLNGLLVRGVSLAEEWIQKGNKGRPKPGDTA